VPEEGVVRRQARPENRQVQSLVVFRVTWGAGHSEGIARVSATNSSSVGAGEIDVTCTAEFIAECSRASVGATRRTSYATPAILQRV
jgi:hypothetical protein